MATVIETKKSETDLIPGIDVCSSFHGREYIIERDGELYCNFPQCGEQLQTPYNTGFEQRVFSDDNPEEISRLRSGPARTLRVHDYGLSTTIQPEKGISTSDGRTRKARGGEYYRFARLRYLQTRARMQTAEERNLARALRSIGRYAETQNLPSSVAESAAFIYRKALKKRLVRGRSIEGIAGASLYIAARNHINSRGIADLAYLSNTRKTLFQWYIRLIMNELDLRPPRASLELVPRILRKIKTANPDARIAPELETQTLEILRTVKQSKYAAGKTAKGLIAPAIYIASERTGSRLTQKEIAEAADVTEVTLRNRYKQIDKILEDEATKLGYSVVKITTSDT